MAQSPPKKENIFFADVQFQRHGCKIFSRNSKHRFLENIFIMNILNYLFIFYQIATHQKIKVYAQVAASIFKRKKIYAL